MAFTNQGLPSYSFAMFLAFASFGSYIFSTDPLNTARPKSTTPPTITSSDLNSVSARLWQDPFRVIYKQNNKNKQQDIESLDNGELCKNINEYVTAGNDELLVLGVMVSTESIADAEERRRRNRYALITALSEANYVPEDAAHIRVGMMPEWGETKDPLTLPYEWFKYEPPSAAINNSAPKKKVLLLWLDASHYDETPYSHLKELVSTLAGDSDKGVRQKLRIAILGPAGSGGLNTLIKKSYAKQFTAITPENKKPVEINLPEKNSPKENLPENNNNTFPKSSPIINALCNTGIAGIHFLSPRATVASNRLYAENEPTLEQRFSLQNYRQGKSCLTFHRTIHSDDRLMESIAQELKFRDIKHEHSHVVLLSELDTAFGRALPLTFIEKFCHKSPDTCKKSIHSFHYLRGIDGVAPGSTADIGLSSLKSSTSTKKANKEQSDEILIRRPIGAGQYDYLRRIADEIVNIDSNSRKHNGKGIRAIGVLGSDVYDKLLILHALRSRLMGVTFFTTDLDAQFLHPAEFKWTRNLLIASSFDLKLDETLQKSTPPFRDSYQTSIFYSASLALQLTKNTFKYRPYKELSTSTKENKSATRHNDEQYNSAAKLPTKTSPLLFEVSRNGAIPLLNATHENNNIAATQSILHPVKKEQKPGSTLALIASLLALILLALMVLNERKKITFKFYWLLSGSAVLILISGFGAWCAKYLNEEPFLILSGISIWPTEMINSVAFMLSLYFICLSIRSLNSNHEEIGREFKLENKTKESQKETFLQGNGWIILIALTLSLSALLIAWLPYTIPYSQIYLMQSFWIIVLLLWFSLIYKYHPIKYICKSRCISTAYKRKLLRAVRHSKLAINYNKIISTPVDSINEWTNQLEKQGKISIQSYWDTYAKYASQRNRFLRTCTMVLIFQAFISVIFTLFGLEAPPLRGDFTRYADSAITVASLLGLLVVLFYMADATRLCIAWIRGLTQKEYNWEGSIIKEKADELNIPESYAIHWVKLQIVAQRTEEVGKLIFYPFIIIILILFSRINYFDDWGFPQSLAIITSSLIATALYTAIKLRRVAEKVRSDFIEQLNTDKLIVGGSHSVKDKPTLTQLDELLKNVNLIKAGAFQPLLEQPLVKASLLLLGGVGLSASQFTYLL